MELIWWALIFAVVAIVLAIFGFRGAAGIAASIAKLLVLVFVIIFVVLLIMSLV
ncbi:MAG: DUF1328 family protein [Dehalococcoidia bacterium]